MTGFNIAGDGVPNSGDGTDQDFALVCYNCAQFPDFTLSATPGGQSICAPSNAVYAVDVGQILGYTDPVTLSASGHPAGTSPGFAPNPVTPNDPPNSSTLTIGNTGAAAAGSYAIDVVGVATTSTHTTTVNLNLFTAAPAAPGLLAPANGATNLPLQPSFSWSAPAQGQSYTIEIATDSGFNNIVVSAAGLTGTGFTPGLPLNSNTPYYWRVRADNACGVGANSPTFAFTTEPLPGDCTLGSSPLTLATEDFESGAPGWSHGGAGDTWTLSTARPHTGAVAFRATDVSFISDQFLYSPTYTLPAAGLGPLTLQFWNYQSIEDRTNGCFDGAMLDISTNGGATWTQLPNSALLTDPYDGPISASFGNPAAGLDAWCGDPQDWLESIVDLDAYAGQTVQFRFRLATDSSVSREGWYVDDLALQACLPNANTTLLPLITQP